MPKKKLKIYSWNVNGIRAILNKGFLEWVLSVSPDILCLQETKAFPEQVPGLERDLSGYSMCWNNPSRKGYAGVAIFTKVKPISVETDFGPETFDTEGRALILNYKDLVVINVYFPNGRSNPTRLKYKLDFYNEFLDFIGTKKDKNIIICGDFNTAHKEIDLARPKANQVYSGFLPVERKWIDKFISSGFVDTFREKETGPDHYTWWDYKTHARKRNVGWRIDYFFAKKNMLPNIKDSFILSEIKGSDHCPIGVEVNNVNL